MHLFRTVGLACVVMLTACETAVSPRQIDDSTLPIKLGTESLPSIGEVRTGYIYGEGGSIREVTYEVYKGRAILEGDIDLGPADSIASTPDELRLGRDGVNYSVVLDGNRWTGGIVPYVIDAGLPNTSRVTSAIAHIEANTSDVDFVPRTGQASYVRIIWDDGSCNSAVGKQGGEQVIRLANGCSTGAAIHELNHTLGVWHEQSRCDRDSYVQILWNNIQSGKEHNFEKECVGSSDVFSYDEGSIMHYGPYAFSSNGQPTILSLRGLESEMGQRTALSSVDIASINAIYPGPPTINVDVQGPTIINTEGSYSWEAMPTGGTGPYTYQWVIEYAWGPLPHVRDLRSGKSQVVYVDADTPPFLLRVEVNAGTEYGDGEIYVCNFSGGLAWC